MEAYVPAIAIDESRDSDYDYSKTFRERVQYGRAAHYWVLRLARETEARTGSLKGEPR